MPRCPRRELIFADVGDGEPTEQERIDCEACGLVNQWDRVRNWTHDERKVICDACPLNDGRLPRPTALYIDAQTLLHEIDMGLTVSRADVSPRVLEAAKLIHATRAELREQERHGQTA